LLPKTNAANFWSAEQSSSLWVTTHSTGNPNTQTLTGGSYWDGSGVYCNWGEFNGIFGVNGINGNDWGIACSVAPGALPGVGTNANPDLFQLYLDGTHNRTTVGHSAGTVPTGTAALNVEGTGTIYVSPQNSPQGNNQIWSDGTHLHWRDGNGADHQLDN